MSKEGKLILKALKANDTEREIAGGYKRGYWLVRESDKQRFYISEHVNQYQLEQVAGKVLNDKTGCYNEGCSYWIDYCLGLDVDRRIAWSNIDHTDCFM